MDRFQEIEVFLAACDGGSFVKAGQRLRMSPPAVTRAISALEDTKRRGAFWRAYAKPNLRRSAKWPSRRAI
jgi:hypothetical protein